MHGDILAAKMLSTRLRIHTLVHVQLQPATKKLGSKKIARACHEVGILRKLVRVRQAPQSDLPTPGRVVRAVRVGDDIPRPLHLLLI